MRNCVSPPPEVLFVRRARCFAGFCPAGRVPSPRGTGTKNARGNLPGRTLACRFVLHVKFPGPPFTGGTPWTLCGPSGAQEQACLGAVPAGPTGGLRRRGLRIPRFVLSDKARSLHRSISALRAAALRRLRSETLACGRVSSPTQTRYAGLCVGGRLRRPIWVENCG